MVKCSGCCCCLVKDVLLLLVFVFSFFMSMQVRGTRRAHKIKSTSPKLLWEASRPEVAREGYVVCKQEQRCVSKSDEANEKAKCAEYIGKDVTFEDPLRHKHVLSSSERADATKEAVLRWLSFDPYPISMYKPIDNTDINMIINNTHQLYNDSTAE